METLKNKERATIKNMTEIFRNLSNANKDRLILLGVGMSMAESIEKNTNRNN